MVNPISYQNPGSFVGDINWAPLTNLGTQYREAQDRQRLADLGQQLAAGKIDYRQAAGLVSQGGDLNASLKFLELAEQRRLQDLQQEAGAQAAGVLGGVLPGGGGSAPPGAPAPAGAAPPAAPEPQPTTPTPAARPAAAGPSAPPSVPIATPGGLVGPPKDDAEAAQNVLKLGRVLANPNLPASSRAALTPIYQFNIDQMKDPAEVQKLRALINDPKLMEAEIKLRGASRPQVTVTNTQETEEAKARGKQIPEIAGKVADQWGPAQETLAQLRTLGDLRQDFKTGGPAALQAKLASIGIPIGKNVGVVQAYNSIIEKMAPAQRIPGTGATSDRDLAGFKASLPNLINDPMGNEIISATLGGIQEYRLAQAQIAQEYLTGQIEAKEMFKRARELPDPFSAYKTWKGANAKNVPFTYTP